MGMGKRDTTIGIVFYKNICHRHRSKGNCLTINDSSGDSKWWQQCDGRSCRHNV